MPKSADAGFQPGPLPPTRRGSFRRFAPALSRQGLALAALALASIAAGGLLLATRGGYYVEEPGELERLAAVEAEAVEPGRAARLERQIRDLRPRGTYLIVDTYENRVRVMRNGEVLRLAICSSGSGTVLRDPATGREWIFDTPLGERRVERKVKNPVWVKPDWAFIEEGYVPPARDAAERFDPMSLGRYGLYLGDGYIIHGTLFQSLLGRRVTHGCVRLGDEDLEFVYRTVPLGARVYLY